MYATNSSLALMRKNLETITVVVSLAAPILSLPVVLKALAELRSLPRANWRAEYVFARGLAEETADPHVTAHAEELGYLALVGGRHLTSKERRLLLTLADSSRIIPRFLRVHPLLAIHSEWPILRWKKEKYESEFRRKLHIYGLYVVYFFLAMSASVPLVLRIYPNPMAMMAKLVAEVTPMVSACLLLVAVISAYAGVKLDVASELVREATMRFAPVDSEE